MLESLKEIGEIMLSKGEEFPIEEKRGGEYLCKVIFDLDSGKLDCDCAIKCDEEKAKDYFWVGNPIGQKPQLVLTTDKLKYLLDPSRKHKWAIGQIIQVISERKLAGDSDLRNLRELLIEIKDKFFSGGRNLVQEFETLLGNKRLSREDIALYTVSVREKGIVRDVVKEPGYRKLLNYVLYDTESDKYPKVEGRCHVCGMEKLVLTNPSYPEGTPLIIYNVDKAGFFPGLSRKPSSMARAHAVCVDCKKKLVMGLDFVKRNLTAQIGGKNGLSIYIIPKIVGAQMNYELLEKLAKNMKDAFGAVRTYKSLEKIERTAEEFKEHMRESGALLIYSLNLLFGYSVSSHFTFQYLIQNVPVTRLIELAKVSSRASDEIASLFREDPERWSIGFDDIYNIFPLRRKDNRVADWKPIVELFNAMLNGTSYPREAIISRAVLFARIHRYETFEGYNIKQPRNVDESMSRGILKYNLLLRILGEIGVVSMEKPTIDLKALDEDIAKVFSEFQYSEWQKALFLLGVLVGKIGIEQYKRGDEKKAVLNKINFEGMSAERVKILANYVLEGLRNYRILDAYNEKIYGYMKELLDKNIENLKNPVDNVFYILSGYAYITLKAILGGGG